MSAVESPSEPKAPASAKLHFGVVRVGSTDVAIAARYLTEAVAWPEALLPMPEANSRMRGMFMLRGLVVPVVELAELMASGATAPSGLPCDRGQVAVVTHAGRRLGLAVDSTGEVLLVAPRQLTPLQGPPALFDCWIARTDGRALPVLNIDFLLTATPGVHAAHDNGAAAAASPAALQAADNRYALARAGGQVLAFDLADVPDVLPMPEVKTFMAGTLALQGMVDWRGNELALLNLGQLLGLAPAPQGLPAEKPLMMVLQHAGRRIAVAVDSLLGLHASPADALVPLGASVTLAPSCYAGCIVAGTQGIALVLDTRGLMAHPTVATFLGSARPAQTSRTAGRAARTTFLIYQAGGTCATPLTQVEEIMALSTPPAAIDATDGGMRGLIAWRGRPLPLFDLRPILGRTPTAAPDAQTRVLVVRQGAALRGFMVDRLISLVTAEDSARTADTPLKSGRSAGVALDQLLFLGQGADSLTCQRVDLQFLLRAQDETEKRGEPA